MKVVSLSGSLRESVGKKDAKNLRNKGLVPCVIYGGEKQIHFAVKAIELDKILFTPYVYLIDVVIDGQSYRTLIQDVQYHPVSDKCLHVDFLQIIENKPVKIAVPTKITGTSPGVMKGGKLQKKMRKVFIQALEEAIPDIVEIDISSLEIGMSIRIEDLEKEGITFLDAPRAVVAAVKTSRGGVAAEDGDDDEDEEGEGEGTTEAAE
ncbi:MAG: 50S ribosomal protein L25/general stress protein Ctc [Bacteroidetes bacterium]|nr:MAG: 50S ribosomal protein L25/general stress protein Ctc [Bacteroidota bacterium]